MMGNGVCFVVVRIRRHFVSADMTSCADNVDNLAGNRAIKEPN